MLLWPRKRAGHYILQLWFLSSFFFFLWPPYGIGQASIFLPCDFYLSSFLSFLLFSSPNLSGRRLDVYCLPYFHTWCGLSANLECMSEMCCMRLAENTGRKKSPFWHHRTTLSGCIFVAKACIDNRKKIIKQQYLLHMSLQYIG